MTADRLNTPEKVLNHTDKDMYPNIHAITIVIATLPVTSCECERSQYAEIHKIFSKEHNGSKQT